MYCSFWTADGLQAHLEGLAGSVSRRDGGTGAGEGGRTGAGKDDGMDFGMTPKKHDELATGGAEPQLGAGVPGVGGADERGGGG
ncbi:MAG: hypothetical protein ACTSU5_09080 [Promethearchaeota archaeon]